MVSFQLRSYQKDALEVAKQQNTIVCLPTGYGKTLIAARLMQHYLQIQPGLKVAFLVPTRALVDQQSEYCKKHCSVDGNPTVVQRLVGEEQASWDASMWNKVVQQIHVFLGTAACLEKALVTDKYLNLSQFSLLILDECHNAVGNSPMAAVMRDGVAPFTQQHGQGPRILGLTASFVNGNLRNMEQKRQKLESLLQSTILCPNVPSRLKEESYQSVSFSSEKQAMEGPKEALTIHLEDALKKVGSIKDYKRVVHRSTHVFCELGKEALLYYVDRVICQQIMDKSTCLELQKDSSDTVQYAKYMKANLPVLRIQMNSLLSSLKQDPKIAASPIRTNKLERLLQLLKGIVDQKFKTFCGIVFVEQVALVSTLAQQINISFSSRVGKPVKCGAVAGSGWQSSSDRDAQLEAFAQGKARILVATAALEEGIDLSDCAFVVRFNHVPTTKAHIQGSGRARHPNAEIYYFENNPETEQRKEKAMFQTARDSSLSLSSGELQDGLADMNIAVHQKHPYPFSTISDSNEGVVNVFNCKQIFNQYCSMTLGKSISPKKELYRFCQENDRKVLTHVRYPTPQGWLVLDNTHVRNFWQGVDMEKVFSCARSGKKSLSDKEEMAFVYVVTIELREKNWLDGHNKASKNVIFDIRQSCPADTSEIWGITLQEKIVQSTKY